MKRSSLVFLIFLIFCKTTNSIIYPRCVEGDCKNGIGKLYKYAHMIYEGEFQNGIWHGKGKLIIYSQPEIKCTYEGDFKLGKKEGFGKEICDPDPNPNLNYPYIEYEGYWKSDKWNGEGKVFYRKTGETFVGYAYNNVLCYYGDCYDGESKMIDSQGNQYEGGMFSGRMHGYGKTIERISHFIYEGEWKGGKEHGRGKKIWTYRPNDVWYDGEWRDGYEHGKGIMFYPNGEKTNLYTKTYTYYSYEGDFDNGGRHGKGVFKDKEGNIIAYVKFVYGSLKEAIDYAPKKDSK